MPTKQCTKCLNHLPLDAFAIVRATNEPRSCCIECTKQVRAHVGHYTKKRWYWFQCHQCKELLPKYRFGFKHKNIYGIDYVCKKCRHQNAIDNPKVFKIY